MSLIYKGLETLVTPLIAKKSTPPVRIDEWTFRLHYRVTTFILLLFTALLCMREYIGENIKCSPNHDDYNLDPVIPKKLLETYCFFATTFTIPHDYANSETRVLVRDTLLGGPAYVEGRTERVFHSYYQWVPYFLFLIAFFFYTPHLIWKSIDNNKIQHLIQGLNIRDRLHEAGEKRDHKISTIASYIVQSKGSHGYWASAFVLCEFGNLLVVLATMYLTDLFLGKEFSTYGPRVIQFLEDDPENREDPMASVFPRVTKCLFHMFGPSGTVQRLDALCVLPSNILNEKMFTFLWFWFVFLAGVTILALIYRLALIFSARLRYNALQIEVFPADPKAINVMTRLGLSEWFLLHFIRLNMDPGTFRKLVMKIHEELSV